MTCTLLNLLAKRRNSTGGFVLRDTLDPPQWKEQITKADKCFFVDYRAYPIVERIQVEAAQEYSSRIDFVEHTPAFLARSVKHNQNRSSSMNSRSGLVSFLHGLSIAQTKERNLL